MTLRLAVRSLLTRPVRSAVLACGFGFGIAVMAALLGVGEVILEQARSPALQGGGDVAVSGPAGSIPSARFLLSSVLRSPPLAGRAAAAAPSSAAGLYLVQPGQITRVDARGEIPDLERQLGDPETAQAPAWTNSPEDRRWSSPDPSDVLRAMDRFHPIPHLLAREDSWAEWLYFNGRAADGSVRFYLTFLAGPRTGSGRRGALVRLQLERAGIVETFSGRAEIEEEALLTEAPDMEIGGCRVRLDGLTYRIDLDLPRLRGEVTLSAVPGRSIPPFSIRGAGGWVSGYVVPVLAGPVTGRFMIGSETVVLESGTGYHDHNWGFWEGVTWQWGQVAHEDLSIVYGRVRPPPDAADPDRIPGFLGVLGPEGPLGFSTSVTIEETDVATADGPRPRTIHVHALGESLELQMEAQVESAVKTRMGGEISPSARRARPRSTDNAPGDAGVSEGSNPTTGLKRSSSRTGGRPGGPDMAVANRSESSPSGLRSTGVGQRPLGLGVSGRTSSTSFLQLRALFRVKGHVGDRTIDFTAPGAAEAFRGE